MRRFYARGLVEKCYQGSLKLFAALLLCTAAPAQLRPFVEYSKPAYLPWWVVTRIVVDAQGNTIVAVQELAIFGPRGKSYIQVLDQAGSVRCTHDFNSSRYTEIFALHADSNGFLYAGGRTSHSDFLWTGFLVKFRPCGAEQFTTDLSQYATVTAIATSAAGDLYIAGTDTSGRFPTTPGVFQPSIGQPWNTPNYIHPYGFVARLFPDGQRFLYASYLSGTQRNCSGGSDCVSIGPTTTPQTIVVAPNGDTIVAGSTNTTDFPVTANAAQKESRCMHYSGNVFITRIDSRGERLIYSTYLGGSAEASDPFLGINSPQAVALMPSGSIWVVGSTNARDFPVTPDAAQLQYRGASTAESRDSEGFITRIGRDGRLEYSSYFGGKQAQINAASIQPNGEIWLSGGFAGPDFPATPSTYTRGGDFLTRLAPDGRTILFSTRLPQGPSYFVPLAVVGNDTVLIGSNSGQITRLRLRDSTDPALLGVANAAMGSVSRCVSPGEIVSVHGIDIGTPQPAGYRLDSAGRISGDLDGVRLYFNGMSAPLLYAQSDQINAVTPFALPESGPVSVALVKDGTAIRDEIHLCAAPSRIGLFRTSDSVHLVALNQDGTLNSETNPVAAGSIVTIYLSGAGAWKTLPAEGEIAPLVAQPDALKYPLLADAGLEILYAGPAPGQVVGLIQVNVRVLNRGSVRIFNGSSQDSGVVFVR